MATGPTRAVSEFSAMRVISRSGSGTIRGRIASVSVLWDERVSGWDFQWCAIVLFPMCRFGILLAFFKGLVFALY